MPALDDVSHLTALDSEDRSKSVAEARHLVRAHFLLPLLNAAYEIAMNPATKDRDRLVAQKILIDFASEAQSNGQKTLSTLSPAAAKLIAKYGNETADARKERLGQSFESKVVRDVSQAGEERKRLGDSGTENHPGRGEGDDD